MKRAARFVIVLLVFCGLGYASAVISRSALVAEQKVAVQNEIAAMLAEYPSDAARRHARMPPAPITWLAEKAVTDSSRHPVPQLADGVLVRRQPAYWPSQTVRLPWAYAFARGTPIPFVNRVFVGWQLGRLMGEGQERWFVSLPGWQLEVRRTPLWYF